MKHLEILQQLSEPEKDAFLHAALEKYPDLRKDFIEKHKGVVENIDPDTTYDDFVDMVNNETAEWVEELELVNLVDIDITEIDIPYDHYVPEYELYEMHAENEFEQIFDSWKSGLSQRLVAQDIQSFFAELIAMYNACSRAVIDDEYNAIYDDTESYFKGFYEKHLQEFANDYNVIFLNKKALRSAVTNFFNYLHDHKNDFDSGIFLMLDTLLKNFALNKEDAAIFAEPFKTNKGLNNTFPKLSLQTVSILNPEQWVKHAEQLYTKDIDIAEELMDHYHKNNLYSDFNRTAQKCFSSKPGIFSVFIAERINDDYDPEFTQKVLRYCLIQEEEMSFYRRLIFWLSPGDKEQLIKDQNHRGYFYGRILVEEQRYGEMINFLKSNNHYIGLLNQGKLLLSVYNDKPYDVLEYVRQKAHTIIANQRGRHYYQEVAEFLTMFIEAGAGYEVKEIAASLYAHKPVLPALRNELRQAGLV